MEETVNYNILLSLKESCLRKVTVILWSKPNILESFDQSSVEEKVKEDLSKLELPPVITDKMKSLVRLVGLQIRTWRRFLKKYLCLSDGSFDLLYLRHLCWTSLGTLDYQKIAKKLILSNIIDDSVRIYKLACLFCLDEYIPTLFEKLPDVSKRAFHREKRKNRFFDSEFHWPALQFCWPHILKGEFDRLTSIAKFNIGNSSTFNQYAFEYAAIKGNKAATEYFFHKLTDVEKEFSLFRVANEAVKHRWKVMDFLEEEKFPAEKLSETVFYLLSLLSHVQQITILKTYPGHVFKCLLDWPWRESFFDLGGFRVWTYLLENGDDEQLTGIINDLTSVIYLSKLLQDLLLLSPKSLRKLFVDRECKSGVFNGLFRSQGAENIKVFLRSLECEDRKRLVRCEHIFKIFYELIFKDRAEFVELSFQETPISEEEKKEIQEAYSGFFKNINSGNSNSREKIWKQFLHILQ